MVTCGTGGAVVTVGDATAEVARTIIMEVLGGFTTKKNQEIPTGPVARTCIKVPTCVLNAAHVQGHTSIFRAAEDFFQRHPRELS